MCCFRVRGSNRLKDDSFKGKLERAEYELFEKKIARKKSHPLLFKLVRLLGFEIRPPHYASSQSVFVFSAFYVAILVASLLLFLQRDSQDINLVFIVTMSILTGTICGLIMMFININNKKTYDLTPWEDI